MNDLVYLLTIFVIQLQLHAYDCLIYFSLYVLMVNENVLIMQLLSMEHYLVVRTMYWMVMQYQLMRNDVYLVVPMDLKNNIQYHIYVDGIVFHGWVEYAHRRCVYDMVQCLAG